MLTATTSPPSSAASTWRRSASRATPTGRSTRRPGSASRPFIGTSAAQVLRVQHLPPLSPAWTARPTRHRCQTPSSGRERVAASSSSTPPAASLLSPIPQFGEWPNEGRVHEAGGAHAATAAPTGRAFLRGASRLHLRTALCKNGPDCSSNCSSRPLQRSRTAWKRHLRRAERRSQTPLWKTRCGFDSHRPH